MQSVNAAWTVEERDPVRKIAQGTLISWHKQSNLGNRTFTIGVSLIGGNDIIGVNPGAIGSPGNYKYFDESSYIMGLSWERGLNFPTGGLTKALAEVRLDNTSGRFTPRYMGGSSELYTAILPSRPVIINAGFNFGVDQTIPQFAGLVTEQPEVSMRDRQVRLRATDYTSFFQGVYIDQESMFTSKRTDEVMTTLLTGTLGMNTAQFDLDYGINLIPFGIFEAGTLMSKIFHDLVEAENGHFYQDESGIFKFENRQHWDSSPYTQVQRIIYTAQVLQAQSPNQDHIVNVVEVKSAIIEKQPLQIVFQLGSPLQLNPNSDTELFVSFDDPILAITTPSAFLANSSNDGTGTDLTSSVSVKSISKFAKTAKIIFTNSSSTTAFMTELNIYGRPAKKISDLYYRAQDDSSVTAYQEKLLTIDNPYIQNQSWAASYAGMILNDFSDIEKLQKITIRAVPELQMGDLISWQGRYWRVYDIKTILDPSYGFIQELTLLQRTITSYFRIGISTIGGTDRIAP